MKNDCPHTEAPLALFLLNFMSLKKQTKKAVCFFAIDPVLRRIEPKINFSPSWITLALHS